MDFKKLAPIISMISVVVMIVWGFLANDWSKCWLSVVVGGLIIGILKVVGDNGNSGDKK